MLPLLFERERKKVRDRGKKGEKNPWDQNGSSHFNYASLVLVYFCQQL